MGVSPVCLIVVSMEKHIVYTILLYDDGFWASIDILAVLS